jgi:hypothetical protein
MPKLTVVSYCHEAHKHFIPFWAEQLTKQTYKDFDVLFIAHNWGEESLIQANKNRDEFSIMLANSPIWTQGPRRGVRFESFWSPPVIGAVIDHGASLVDTEFMAHHDLDDIIHPQRLQLQYDYLVAHPEIDFLGTRMVGFNGEPAPEMLELDYVEPNEPNMDVRTHEQIVNCMFGKDMNCLGHTTMVYRPEVLKQLGGFSRSDVKLDGKSPDFETWKKAIMAGYKFYRLPQLCALWRLDSSSIRL